MNKITIVLIVFMMVGVGFLSGCNEQSSGSGYIEIVSHDIAIKRGSYIVGDIGNISSIRSLFGEYREVYGTVKNIVDENVDYVEITVKFFDNDNELISTKKTRIGDIASGETKDFSVQFGRIEPYYNQYDHYTVSVWSRK